MDQLYWTLAYRELSQKVQLKLGETNSLVLCNHSSLVSVISQALGGSSESSSVPERDLTKTGASFEKAISSINALYQT